MAGRVAIVGAGVTGLVAARELARRGFAIEIFERWPDIAGQVSAFEVAPGVWLERYYHHLFQSDHEMIELHNELLPGQLEWHRSSVGIYAQHRVWPFVSPRDLLGYGPLPPADRLRLGFAILRLVGREDWQAMDDIPALDWLSRNCGERTVRTVWLPLLLGKFGNEASSVPLAWLWSKFKLRRRLRGGGAAMEELGYPRGSFRSICLALAKDVRRAGGALHVDREVVHVREDDGSFVLHCAPPDAYRQPLGTAGALPGREARADIVLFTTPTFVTRRLTDWPEHFAADLEGWTYRAAVVLLLELRRSYSNVYWLNVADTDVPFLGVVEHTNLVPAERYPAHYAYVSNYVAVDDPLTRLGTEGLFRHYLEPLRRMNPSFQEADVLRRWSFREDAAQPIPTLGTRRRILPYASPRRGLWLANTTQIYPEDRGTNYSARLGKLVAGAIADGAQHPL
jgi:protoporphyrinogen oxidase